MMDLIVVSLILIVPCLIFSIRQAKAGKIRAHRLLQMILSAVLLFAVTLFELEMQWVGGIEVIMEKDRYTTPFRIYLWTHIGISITTILVWGTTLFKAMKAYDGVQLSAEHRALHRKLGWASTLLLFLTSLTGLGVYAWCFL